MDEDEDAVAKMPPEQKGKKKAASSDDVDGDEDADAAKMPPEKKAKKKATTNAGGVVGDPYLLDNNDAAAQKSETGVSRSKRKELNTMPSNVDPRYPGKFPNDYISMSSFLC